MDERNTIPMPTGEERTRSIRRAVDAGLPPRPGWRELPWSALVFGVEDCLFLAAILGGLCFFPAASLAQEPDQRLLPALLFLIAPALYAALQVLTSWKEAQSGALEWKRTCRVSPRTVAALRMLAFGGASSAAWVPLDLLLWDLSGGRLSLPWLLGLSFAGLFLYAVLTLLCQRCLRRGRVLLPPVVWSALSLVLLRWELAAPVLSRIPALVFFLTASAALACCLGEVRRAVRYPERGGFSYALR